MGRGHEKTFLQREHTNGQQTHIKMLNDTNHQGNANQNHNEIQPHTSQNGYYQNSTNNMLARCGKKRIPPALQVGLQTGIAPKENSMDISQKTKNVYAQQFHFLVFIKKNVNTNSKRYICSLMFFALFTIARIWKLPVSIDR